MKTILGAVLMMTVGFAMAEGWEAHQRLMTKATLTVDVAETQPPFVVLAATNIRQPKAARQQSEGCEIAPNRELGQQKADKEEDRSLMKGLVF